MKNVVFDVGGVLMEWNAGDIVARAFEIEEMRRIAVEKILSHPEWSKLDQGVLSWDEAVVHFAGISGLTQEQVRLMMDTAVEYLAPKQDTLEIVKALKAAGTPLYILSDMPHHTHGIITSKYSFWDLFDGLVFSAKVGMTKRDPAIFRCLLDTYSLDAAETVFIDDAPGNLSNAALAGIKGILFKGAADCRGRLAALGFGV